jgi:hypothetical protein
MRRTTFIVLVVILAVASSVDSRLAARDVVLVIGGGYSPTGNQASLEKNVLFFQRLLGELMLDENNIDVLFSDGSSKKADLQVNDLEAVPLPNRLMAEFFGSQRDLGMTYRNHEVPGVRGASSPENLSKWFREVGSELKSGDRLLLYVTAHGGESRDRSNPHNTTIYMWNNRRITVSDLVRHLDGLPEDVTVVTVMVQCHAGGFARYIFDDGTADNPLSGHNRCGFFATIHSRNAAGCTPDIDEADYQEYSSFFWAALGGKDRLGEPIETPDYNGDGVVSFDEAHAYTIIASNTIDLPIKTSGEFLRVHSQFKDDEHADLLGKNVQFGVLIGHSTVIQRAVLDELSKQLKLKDGDRMSVARKRAGERRTGGSGRGRYSGRRRGGSSTASGRLRQSVSSDIRKRWPELANVLSPVATELLTTRSDEFVSAIESHSKYAEYRREQKKEREAAMHTISPDRMRVKYERFIREAENVILARNLELLDDQDHVAAYERITRAEAGVLPSAKTSHSP